MKRPGPKPKHPCCTIDCCGRAHRARGLCDMHYRQARHHGMALLPTPDPMGDFWSKINKSGPTSPSVHGPCWLWLGLRDNHGYGLCARGRVHRYMMVLQGNVLRSGMCVLHRCDNPECCNPDHLWIGTQSENIADMNAKGRSGNQTGARVAPRGSGHPMSKLDDAMVLAIRRRHDNGDTTTSLAIEFDVHVGTIRKIVARKLWGHV